MENLGVKVLMNTEFSDIDTSEFDGVYYSQQV